jgi:hypothetical protein
LTHTLAETYIAEFLNSQGCNVLPAYSYPQIPNDAGDHAFIQGLIDQGYATPPRGMFIFG